jgi:hypothetical protein
VLVITAGVALWGLRLTTNENERQRAEQRKQPRRELLLDVVRELKELAHQAEIREPGSGYFDTSQLAAKKLRLRIALDYFPATELPRTRAAADQHDLTQQVAREAVGPAAAELATELRRLETTSAD